MSVRVRFAPSPTGHLHIGSARTAVFNWLYARHAKGKFLLRIEDTDKERSKKEFTEAILEGLKWLGIDWDEEPIYQSSRLAVYKETAEKLVAEGKAYYCSCTPEELEEMREQALKTKAKPKYDGRCREKKEHPKGRPLVIRFKSNSDGITVVEDIIQGRVVFDNSELDDLIILRSDGTPTYNFSAVIDDHYMGITHIIRGNDHLNNTPRQIQIYQALGYPIPVFAHHPLILGEDRAKLSKRHGATGLIEFREQGYLPEALINFLVRIGWSYGDKEVFSIPELIELFEIKDLNRSPGVWNQEKLLWLNGYYLRNKSLEELSGLVLPYFLKKGYPAKKDDYLLAIIKDYQVRAKTLMDFPEMAGFYYLEQVEYEPGAKAKFLNSENLKILQGLEDKIQKLEKFEKESLEKAFQEFISETGLKMKEIAQPVRVALTGGTVSPGIMELMVALGKERVLKRLDSALKLSA